MSPSGSPSSLDDLCGRIRHLDAPRARRLVEAFDRPLVHDGHGFVRDEADRVVAEAHGRVTLATAARPGNGPDVVACAQTNLHLHRLLRLPLSVARELAAHRGHLYLDGLTTITDAVAEVLARHEGGCLSLDGLRTLSPAAAAALGTHDGALSLNGVCALPKEVARGLARHAHPLRLNGLRVLTPEAAAALEAHRGNLHLHRLPVVRGPVAEHLALLPGQLHLHEVTSLSEASAAAFGGRTGHLCLPGLERLSPSRALVLARHRGELQIPAVTIDDALAEAFGTHEGSLLIRVPADIPPVRLEALVRHRGPLQIGGLKHLDLRRARVLAAQAGPRGVSGLSCLFLGDITSLSPAVAGILATHRAGSLALTCLTELSADVARELVKHPLLALDGLERVSDEVAAVLATHAGVVLSLRGLKQASPRAIALLKACPSVDLGWWHHHDAADQF